MSAYNPNLSRITPFLKNVSLTDAEAALREADDFAVANILHRKDGKAAPSGGPFGARNYVYDINLGLLVPAGDLRANNVVGTGIVSNHAEAMALQPNQLSIWRDKIEEIGPEYAIPVQISSAESCPACYAKQMIWQFRLVNAGLIKPGRMAVIFNATFDDTLQKAGFNDLPYAIAALARSQNSAHPGLMVRQQDIDWNDIPQPVKEIFLSYTGTAKGESLQGLSVIFRAASTYLPELVAAGYDIRPAGVFETGDPFATSEVQAIRNKCMQDRTSGIFESWATMGALYTVTEEIGPLMHAEAQWASIGQVFTIRNAPASVARIEQTREAPSLSNSDFYRAATAGYNMPEADVSVLRTIVENKSQPLWPGVLKEVMGESGQNAHYDGLGGLEDFPALKAVEAEYRRRFTAPLLSDFRSA